MGPMHVRLVFMLLQFDSQLVLHAFVSVNKQYKSVPVKAGR